MLFLNSVLISLFICLDSDTTPPQFSISVIIPIYNTGRYLHETLDSLMHQTIGFNSSIQVILVNDGSTDETEQICLQYCTTFPSNILYLSQEHKGVSYARNAGIPFAKGKFINFLDSDDKWDLQAFAYMLNFFETYYNEVDVVTARMRFFEGSNKFHILDYKFSKTNVVNLLSDYKCIQLSAATCFIKREMLDSLHFSEKLQYQEDAQLINSILLDKCRLGIVKEALYLCRRRIDGSSAVQNSVRSSGSYLNSAIFFAEDLVNQSLAKYGKVQDFIQYVIMYDLQWKVTSKPTILSQEDYTLYRSHLISILQYISVRIILDQKFLSLKYKIACISAKLGFDIRADIECSGGNLYYKKNKLISLRNIVLICWTFFSVQNNMIIIEGRDLSWLDHSTYTYLAVINESFFNPTYIDYPMYDEYSLFSAIQTGRTIKFQIPFNPDTVQHIRFFISLDNCKVEIISSFSKHFRIPTIARGYYVADNSIFTFEDKVLHIYPYSTIKHIRAEYKYLKVLTAQKKFNIIGYRLLFYLSSIRLRSIWILSDRINKADDNGEALFRFILSHKVQNVVPYYCISSHSKDYHRLKKLPHILDVHSVRYKLYSLLADRVISSDAEDFILRPFETDSVYLRDLLHADFVFLQHGVTKDNISEYMHRYNKNVKLFVAVAERECHSLSQPSYGYKEENIKVLGFPRFDQLLNLQNTKSNVIRRQILVIPTWRQELTRDSYVVVDEGKKYFKHFCYSNYCQFYNTLINHPRLLAVMITHSYVGLFCLHPVFAAHWKDFHTNAVFRVQQDFPNYQKIFVESSLLVTDYSSVAFDFSYLRKPIIYSQFDRDQFFAHHSYRPGYFNYEEDGFGPVCHSINETIDTIISFIELNCTMSSQYRTRVEGFFHYIDCNNSERVYQSILVLPPAVISYKPRLVLFILLMPIYVVLILTVFTRKILSVSLLKHRFRISKYNTKQD